MTDTQSHSTANQSPRFQRNHDRIYDAAIALFMARGPDAVTMEEIATAAGMSRSSVFNHFPSKTLILATFFTRMTDGILTEARNARTGDFRSAITRFAHITGRHVMGHGPIVLTIAGLTSPNQPLEPAEQAADAAILTYLQALIGAGQSRGEIRVDHCAQTLANLLLAVLTATAHEWVRAGQKADLSVLLESRFSLILDGLMQKG